MMHCANDLALSTVSSALLPSEIISSASGATPRKCRSSGAKFGASFKVGIMMETDNADTMPSPVFGGLSI
jgi:hypothetical protein